MADVRFTRSGWTEGREERLGPTREQAEERCPGHLVIDLEEARGEGPTSGAASTWARSEAGPGPSAEP
ncbi:hypothetical protein MFU01_02830 [Myxococcus fulvus]|uniref:Uncharacterized protein n=1 Tax=Myxococcus fulvus TaxID=33 RepID=A0A511STJ5_MYXFU|nr:hypothetical protein MFU01_02830 [Myxococcus fulvus]